MQVDDCSLLSIVLWFISNLATNSGKQPIYEILLSLRLSQDDMEECFVFFVILREPKRLKNLTSGHLWTLNSVKIIFISFVGVVIRCPVCLVSMSRQIVRQLYL